MVVAIKFIDLSHTSLDSEQYHFHPVDGQYPAPCGYRIYYTHFAYHTSYMIYLTWYIRYELIWIPHKFPRYRWLGFLERQLSCDGVALHFQCGTASGHSYCNLGYSRCHLKTTDSFLKVANHPPPPKKKSSVALVQLGLSNPVFFGVSEVSEILELALWMEDFDFFWRACGEILP